MKDLEFRAETHEYFYKGKRVPGVNECLRDAKIIKEYSGDPWYGEMGRAVHKAIELYLKGTLDEDSIDEQIKPRFEAFKRFWGKDRKDKILHIEEPFSDGVFAGTPDLVTESYIFDWKNTQKHKKEDELKGQGYKTLLADFEPFSSRDFIIVELHDDGTYSDFNYGYENNEWASVMKLRNWHNTPNSKRLKNALDKHNRND